LPVNNSFYAGDPPIKITAVICALFIAGLAPGFAPEVIAESVRNGNELAWAWGATNAAGKPVVQKQAVGLLHTFRYLRVTAVKKDQPAAGAVTVMTIEPSSDMAIALVITKRLSLDLANGLTTNDCVSAYGRIKTIGGEFPNLIVVDPAILKHKDRAGPKLSKELLHEVDPAAH